MSSHLTQAKTFSQTILGQSFHHTTPSPNRNINVLMSSFLNDYKTLIDSLISLLTKVIFSLLDKKND